MSGELFMEAVRAGRRDPVADRQRAQRDLPGLAAELRGRSLRCRRGVVFSSPHRAALPYPGAQRAVHVTPEQACSHPNWVMGRRFR